MTTKINVKGAIIGNDHKEMYEWFGMESTCPNDVLNALPSDNSAVEVLINSGGGHIDAGSEIYALLKEYTGHVTTKITGQAASAASVVAMAGDTVIMAPTGQLMIHNVSMIAQGDTNDMQHAAGVLKELNKGIANAYILKTGKSEKEILGLMDEETWLSARTALNQGFVDEILGVTKESLSSFMVASTNASGVLPSSALEKFRKMKTTQAEEPKNNKKTNAKLFMF